MNTLQEIAAELNNRQYSEETTPEIIALAKKHGVVIVFAYSDDNTEFRGAIDEVIPCWNGELMYFNKDGSNFTNGAGEAFLTNHKDKDYPESNHIKAVWCDNERVLHQLGDYYAWTYKTEIPHETFDILQDEQPFCRGIVFFISDLV